MEPTADEGAGFCQFIPGTHIRARTLRWKLWELVCACEGRIDVDDLIQVLEGNGWPCPPELEVD